MLNTADLTDQELDGLIQDLAQKLAKAKILGETSEAFLNLQNTYQGFVFEQRKRYGGSDRLFSGVVSESDPSMRDIPFVDHVRKIPTF